MQTTQMKRMIAIIWGRVNTQGDRERDRDS